LELLLRDLLFFLLEELVEHEGGHVEGLGEQLEHDLDIIEPVKEDGAHGGGDGAVEEEVGEDGGGLLELEDVGEDGREILGDELGVVVIVEVDVMDDGYSFNGIFVFSLSFLFKQFWFVCPQQ